MPCKHGTPYPNECMWSGAPPYCDQCALEAEGIDMAAIRRKHPHMPAPPAVKEPYGHIDGEKWEWPDMRGPYL